MSYSPVSPNLDNSDQWQETAGGSIDGNLQLFERYIQEVILKKDISYVTTGEFVNPDTSPQEWLNVLRNTDFVSDPSRFEQSAKNLSEELNSSIHPRANDGVLFLIQATVSGEAILDDNEH